MATIANLLVKLGADFGNTKVQTDDLSDSLKKVNESSKHAKEGLEDVGHGAEETGDQFEGVKEKLADFGKELLAFGAETLVISSAFETLKESLEISAEIESISVAFEQFTGSAEKASESIEEFEDIAKSEALKFPEILPAAQHFMALGFSAEETTRTMEVAGNASWALGTSIESVSQRMGMMAEGGMVSGRFLRTLGISIEDLAKAMGITGNSTADLEDKVRRAFRFEDEQDRLEALQLAMDKFSGLGAKEAETLTGKWIEMKNALHETFANLGDDLTEAANAIVGAVTVIIEAFGALFNQLNMIKNIKTTVEAPKLKYIDESGKSEKTLSREDLAGGTQTGVPGISGVVGSDVTEAVKKKAESSIKATQASSDASKKALAESNAQQEYEIQKARIDAEENTQKSILKIQLDYYRSQADAKRISASELIAIEKSNAFAVMQTEIDSLNKKKALQSNSKGLKDESKDATLDTQIIAAKNRYNEQVAQIDNKELDRQHKVVEEGLKIGDAADKKLDAQQDKQLKSLQDFVFSQENEWQKEIESEQRAALARSEATAKSAGVSRSAGASADTQSLKKARLSEERSYGLEYTNTLAQQIAHLRTIGNLEAETLDIKTREAEAAAKSSSEIADQAEALASVSGTQEDIQKAIDLRTKANQDELKVQEAQNAAANARYETETKIADLIHNESIEGILKKQFVSSGEAVPGALGGALSAGIFHQGKGGIDVGKQIADAMRNIGKNLLGDVFTAAIKELIVKLGLNTLAQEVMHVVFQTNTATQTTSTAANTTALAANTTALAANTAAQATSAGVGAGGAAATAATAAATAATGAVSSIIGPVIGGVISGVISAAATFIGDAAIIKAINQTTAAVLLLRNSPVAGPTGSQSGTGTNNQTLSTPSTSLIANIGASLFQSFTGSNAIPVRLMAINPGIAFASIAGLFGFAEGGTVPADMLAQVHKGEHVLTKDQVAGIEPLPDLPAFHNLASDGVIGGNIQNTSSYASTASHSVSIGAIHMHGLRDVRDAARRLPDVLKNVSPKFKPASS